MSPRIPALMGVLAVVLAACGDTAKPTAPVKSPAQSVTRLPAPEIEKFLDAHWARPNARVARINGEQRWY